MIAKVIKQLQAENWHGCGESIEIAKGKNATPKTWKEAKEQIRRARKMEAAKLKTEIANQWLIKKLVRWLLNKK